MVAKRYRNNTRFDNAVFVRFELQDTVVFMNKPATYISYFTWDGFGVCKCNENCKRRFFKALMSFVYKSNASLHVTYYWCSKLSIVK